MEYAKPKVIEGEVEYEILSFIEYKNKIGFPLITNPTIDYQINEGNIDFVTIGRFRYIVFNDRAKNYRPGENYRKKAATQKD